MIYNIIGDIHYRTNWKKLVSDEYVNIFVGDYFSPYVNGNISNYLFFDGRTNFLDIIKYKDEHPETILLIGNHDEDHWHICERYSRHDERHCSTIKMLFDKYSEYFNAAYSINNEVLVTHAGVSLIWYLMYRYNRLMNAPIDINDDYVSKTIEEAIDKANSQYMPFIIDRYYANERCVYLWHNKKYWFNNNQWEPFTITPKEVAAFVNELWKEGNYHAFNFRNNASPNDACGEDVHHGPMWIRPVQLQEANIFKYDNYAQVVGHTQFPSPTTYRNNISQIVDGDYLNSSEEDKIFFCDCLRFKTASILYNDETKKFTINNKN